MEAIAATRYLNKKSLPQRSSAPSVLIMSLAAERKPRLLRNQKVVPGAEIVYEAWPKLGEKDFTAFITAIMAKKPDAVHGSLFGGDLVSFTKQAAPYGFFEKTPFIALYDFLFC